MSFRLQPTPVARPNRCQLFGPGSRVALFEKMAASAADVINLDLEAFFANCLFETSGNLEFPRE